MTVHKQSLAEYDRRWVVVCSDGRGRGRYFGMALATNGLYVAVPGAFVDPVTFRSLKDATEAAKAATRESREQGDGNGHGIFHGTMSLETWLRYAKIHNQPKQEVQN